ncbi:MAG: Arginine decarboxylase [Candidatus Nomurabacteria bacterium GW2011_GWA2_43_15]|uniref:Arginine decarboxylase n=2 Tax=Candidatus Nomuraibacteriota TaxID=1752729 RepID=A0A0G1DTC3_9BACT|nr:MAG: Arginine decarboxylase [Candidatus Nomurabacteria bacterium GW2011_GWA2_43_15]KKT19966.1 MAG: Arginine decarboxylase [Candidatus Nomurabacteria bacterium GW2011_GWB1_43_7]
MDEFNTQYFDVSPDGDLVVKEGHYQYNIMHIVRKYGTPARVFFPFVLENRVRDLIELFNAYIKILNYKGKFYYHYVMKSNQNEDFVLPAIAEGAHIETSSANELWLVKRMLEQGKFNRKIRVTCNGPKTEQYISLVEELKGKGLSVIPVIENSWELERLKKFKGEVGVRVNLDIKVDAHWDKKYNHFGFTEEELLKIGKIRNLSILHYHISTQNSKIEGFIGPLKRAVALYAKMREQNHELDTINFGGGMAVPYEKKKKLLSVKNLVNQMVKTAKKESDKLGVRHPNLICEWGSYFTAPSQITIFKILCEKNIIRKPDTKWYFIDGSFIAHLTDTWSAVRQKWHFTTANNLNSRRLQKVWIAGSTCDSDDRYTASGSYVMLPKITEDNPDLYLVVYDTGSYQDTFENNHCLLSRPALVVCQNGEVKLARRRQTPEELGKLFGWNGNSK